MGGIRRIKSGMGRWDGEEVKGWDGRRWRGGMGRGEGRR